MYPRRIRDSTTPSLASECAPPPGTKGGAHSPAGEELGESQFRRLEKSLALCLLCAFQMKIYFRAEKPIFTHEKKVFQLKWYLISVHTS
jgi:hypothetical protein